MLRPIRRIKKKNLDIEDEVNLVRDRCSECNKIILTSNQSVKVKLCDPCSSKKATPKIVKQKNEKKTISKNNTNNSNNTNQKRNVCQSVKRSILKSKPKSDLNDANKSNSAGSIRKKRHHQKDFIVPKVLPCKLGSFTVLRKVLCNGFLYSIADIVSLQSNNCVYYAQIRIFIEDSFCEKYAALVWLLPTSSTSGKKCGFEPDTFTYGPQDEWFYHLNELKFVMHPPSEYYRRFIFPVPKSSEIVPVVKQKFKPTFKRKM